jgi:hypothetical protein
MLSDVNLGVLWFIIGLEFCFIIIISFYSYFFIYVNHSIYSFHSFIDFCLFFVRISSCGNRGCMLLC